MSLVVVSAPLHALQCLPYLQIVWGDTATAAGVTDDAWTMKEVARLIAALEETMAKYGPYKKKAA